MIIRAGNQQESRRFVELAAPLRSANRPSRADAFCTAETEPTMTTTITA